MIFGTSYRKFHRKLSIDGAFYFISICVSHLLLEKHTTFFHTNPWIFKYDQNTFSCSNSISMLIYFYFTRFGTISINKLNSLTSKYSTTIHFSTSLFQDNETL